LVSNATVNRTTTGALRTLFAFAKSEGVRFDHEPHWLRHMLAKPEERLRELHDDEAERIDAATPVTEAYKVPFKFTGKIAKVTIELKEMKKTDLDDAVHARKAAALKKGLSD
jgi:hypothetical protein